MTYKENITAILECYFTGFEKEIIDSACNRILEQDPTIQNDVYAQERYQDLTEYFSDEKIAKTILESRKEFKAWLERLRWYVKRVDELARELERLKELRAEIAELDNKVCQQFLIEDVDKEVHRAYQDCLNIIDKYNKKAGT